MHDHFRQRITHRDDDVSSRSKAAIGLGKFNVTLRSRHVVETGDERHRIERRIVERKVCDVLNDMGIRQALVPIDVNSFTVTTAVLRDEQIVLGAADVERIATDFACDIIEPFGSERRQPPTIVVENGYGTQRKGKEVFDLLLARPENVIRPRFCMPGASRRRYPASFPYCVVQHGWHVHKPIICP